MPIRHILLTLLVVAIWGFNFTVIKFSVAAMPPFLAAGFRFALTAFPAILFVRPPRVPARNVIAFGVAFGFGLYAFLNVALANGLTAGLASVVMQMQAFFTMILALFLLGERPRRRQVAGAVIAFAGVGVFAAERAGGTALVPLVLALGGAASWGVANIISKRSPGADPLALTVWGAAASCVPLFGTSLLLEGPDAFVVGLTQSHWTTWLVIGFLAYPATLFGLAVWNWLLRQHPASTVAPFTLLVPISGLLSGMLMLGETVSGWEIVGGLMVIAGLLVTVIRPKAKRDRA